MQSTGSAAWKATSFPGSVTGSSTRLVRATCADALRPIWLTKTVTACRTRQRMQPSCSGCGHTVTSRRILSWQSTTPSKTVDPSDTPTGNAVAPGAAIRRDSPCPAHTGSNEMPGSSALFHPTATCPRTRRPAACRHHQKKIASGVRSMLEWVRRSMARSTMSPTRCRPRAWLIQPAGTTRTLTPAQRSVDTDVRQCISRKP